jgi:uncharacterized protein (TIGR04562 family)
MYSGPISHYQFDPHSLAVVAGGVSVLDQPKLHIRTPQQADDFIKSYGYDLSRSEDLKRLWYFHRRSVVFLTDKLKFNINDIPEKVRDPEKLIDLRNLLIWASQLADSSLQKWSCAVLRCLHIFIHAETDLFSFYAEEIQKQILRPFERSVIQQDELYLRAPNKDDEKIKLFLFEMKPFKTSSSTVIKLLAKPDASAMKVFDKVGVRFVTNSIFDAYQVLRFMIAENLISYPHVMPEQSSNNMYPIKEFLEICEKLEKKHGPLHRLSSEKIDRLLKKQLELSASGFLNFFRKENNFSASDFKYIKFISRKLIRIQTPNAPEFSFFYPFEVQLLTKDAYDKMGTGDSKHEAYKNRQIEAVRQRIFPNENKSGLKVQRK